MLLFFISRWLYCLATAKMAEKASAWHLAPVKMATVLPAFALNKDGDDTSCSPLSPSTKMVLMVQVP